MEKDGKGWYVRSRVGPPFRVRPTVVDAWQPFAGTAQKDVGQASVSGGRDLKVTAT